MPEHARADQSTTSERPASQPGTSTPNDSPQQRRGLNDLQRDYLLRPLDARRVSQDPKGFNHLEAWDVRRHLIRFLGFGGWSLETLALDLVRENQTKTSLGREAWAVLYRAQVRLTVRDPQGNTLTTFDDAAAGDAILPSLGDAHDMAMKKALSQALKRCATNMGDAFGLSLYDGGGRLLDNGTVQPVVQATLDVHGATPKVRDEPVRGEQDAA